MTITTQQHAIDLMPQLRDILELPRDLDLPPLWSIVFQASQADSGWKVTAQLDSRDLSDRGQWDALKVWSSGVEPVLGEPMAHGAGMYPSGAWRRVAVTVVVAEVAVEIWAHVDSLFEPPQPEPVHLTGAFADFLLGEEVAQ